MWSGGCGAPSFLSTGYPGTLSPHSPKGTRASLPPSCHLRLLPALLPFGLLGVSSEGVLSPSHAWPGHGASLTVPQHPRQHPCVPHGRCPRAPATLRAWPRPSGPSLPAAPLGGSGPHLSWDLEPCSLHAPGHRVSGLRGAKLLLMPGMQSLHPPPLVSVLTGPQGLKICGPCRCQSLPQFLGLGGSRSSTSARDRAEGGGRPFPESADTVRTRTLQGSV